MCIYKYPFLISISAGLFLLLNFYMYFFFYDVSDFKWVSLTFQIKNYLETVMLFFTIGFIISVFVAIAIGWPLYRLAKQFSMTNYFTSALAGAIVAITPLVFCIIFGWNIPSLTTRSGGTIFLVLVFCGAVSGMIYMYLSSMPPTTVRENEH